MKGILSTNFPSDKIKPLLLVPALTILFLIPVYYIYYRTEAFGFWHDDGLYLVTAQSLAKTGNYSIPSLPQSIPQTKYPPLYPLILALLLKIRPEIPSNLWLLKLSSLVFALLWYGLIYRFLSRRYSPGHCYFALSFVMICNWCIYLSASLLPDLLFALLCLASVIALDESNDRPTKIPPVIIAATFAAAAFLVNTKGITVILAGLAFLILHRRWKQTSLFGILASIACLPWLIWQRISPAPDDLVLRYYSKASYAGGHIFGNCTVMQALSVIGKNSVGVVQGLVNIIGISAPRGFSDISVLAVVLALLAMRGAFLTVRTRISAVDLWFSLYVGMLLCWIWEPSRYLVPILPIFLGYVGLAGVDLMSRIPGVLRPRTVGLCLTLTGLVMAASTSYRAALMTREQNAPAMHIAPESWQATTNLCNWISRNTRPEAVIGANLDPVVYLLTHRQSVRLFNANPYQLFYSPDRNDSKPLGDVTAFSGHLVKHKVSYIVLTPVDYFAETPYMLSLLAQLAHRYPKGVRLVKCWKDPSAQVWQIDPEKLAALQAH